MLFMQRYPQLLHARDHVGSPSFGGLRTKRLSRTGHVRSTTSLVRRQPSASHVARVVGGEPLVFSSSAVQWWLSQAQGNTVQVMSFAERSQNASKSTLHLAERVGLEAWGCLAPGPITGVAGRTPNPSIERTVSSGLRPLPTAAHVKR